MGCVLFFNFFVILCLDGEKLEEMKKKMKILKLSTKEIVVLVVREWESSQPNPIAALG